MSTDSAYSSRPTTPKSKQEITENDRLEAEKLKNEGNQAFSQKHWQKAIDLYTKAIELNPYEPSYFSNRAFANIKEEYLGSALIDANKAIELDPKFIKAYYRRATANYGMNKIKEALADFRAVVKVAPNDVDAKRKLTEVEKEYRKRQFEDAIAVEESSISALQQIGDVDAIMVESSYDGPHLSPPITLDFVNQMLDHLKAQKKIHRKYVYQIMRAVKDIVQPQPSLVDVQVPKDGRVIIVGDVHGQYYDLLNIFAKNGMPSEKNIYIFNGDFVDRGSWSVEVIQTLFAFKALYPQHFFLSRGNHEANDMNKMYGFEGEVKSKYNDVMFKFYSEIFNALPVAHVVSDEIFIVHGGLAGKDVTLDEIRKLDRFRQPGADPLLQDLLWADPQPFPGRGPSKRGAGLQFGPDVTSHFLKTNGLELLVRSHEMKEDGYEIAHDGKCITVFSAPNYCDQMGNKASVVHVYHKDQKGEAKEVVVKNDLRELRYEIVQFDAVPHPENVKAMQYANQMLMGM